MNRLVVTSVGMPQRRAADRWLKMAQEARAIARHANDPAARQRLLEIASDYDRLAEKAGDLERRRGGRRADDPAS